MTRLILAIQFMTRLPMPRVSADEADFAASMRWFPAAGMIVGALVFAAAWAGAYIDPWMGALAALIAWVAVTGALHLDGLGDIADAAGGAHRDPAKLQEILADPRSGTFAVVVIALQLIAKLILLHLLIAQGAFLPLLAIPAMARIGTLVWTMALPQLSEGIASRFVDAIGVHHIALWSLIASGVAIFAPPLFVLPLLWLAWGLWLKRRIGGISGDGHGAGIELVEGALLLALVIGA